MQKPRGHLATSAQPTPLRDHGVHRGSPPPLCADVERHLDDGRLDVAPRGRKVAELLFRTLGISRITLGAPSEGARLLGRVEGGSLASAVMNGAEMVACAGCRRG